MSNAINDNLVDDKELNEYLSGDTQYSQLYRAMESDTVPPEIDALVLGGATAGNVVPISAADGKSGRPSRAKSSGFWMRVSVPVTLAASFVLAISVMIDSDVRRSAGSMTQSERDTKIASSQKAARDTAPAAEQPLSFSEQEKVADKFERDVAASPPLAKSLSQEESRRQEPQAPPPVKIASASAPTADRTRVAEAPAVSKLEGVVVTGQYRQNTAEDAALPVDVITAEDLAPARSDTQAKGTETAKANAAAKVDAPAPAQRSSVATDLEEVVVTAQKRTSTGGGAGPRSSVPASFDDREPSDAEIAKQQREANPVTWVAYIRELRADGKSRAADREWQRFVKAYPNFTVDELDTARPKQK